MFKFKLLTICAMIAVALGLRAQVVTYSPDPLYDNSENVTIYFHADQGSKGLANQAASVKIYAHTGLITSASKDDSDWKYATKWLDNDAKYEMTYVSPNLYKLEIGDIKTFYGVKNANEVIKDLVFVFRNATGSKEGKGVNGANILVPVISTALQYNLTYDAPSTTLTPENATVTFKLTANKVAEKMWFQINGIKIRELENVSECELTYTFTELGRYNVYGYMTVDGKNYNKGVSINFLEGAEQKDYPGGVPKMGTQRQANGDVIFCLGAPEKLACQLVGSWNDYAENPEQKMYYQDYEGQRYFWTSVSGLDNTSMYFYYYNVEQGTKVGDPYAKLVLDPSNDKYIPASVYPNLPEYPSQVTGSVPLAVYQGNINDYAWTDKDFKPVDKKDLVIYEMLFRDFTGTEGKARGDGTVNLALEKLPYLKKLGINAIELLPINEFNGNISWGYNPNFYFAPDKAYGTPDDYKNFINTCHENGIAVILDLVFNQTDWLHPWYRMYSVGSNPMYNADAPHAYSVLNDVNQGHPLIRQQWKDVVKYWLEEYHVDGYRFDLVKGLGDNNSYANSGDAATNAYNASRVANMRAIQEAMNEVNPDAYFINENLAGAREENQMAETGMLNWANVNTEGCQYAMGVSTNSGLQRMWAKKDGGRTPYSTVAYLESHDEERLAYKQIKYGNAVVKNDHQAACRRLGSAAAQMILVPGAHMIWQFSEMGNAQSTKNSTGGNNVDPKIVNWNLLDDPDNNGLYNNYCELIGIRTANPDLFGDQASYNSAVLASNWSKGRTITTNTPDKELICAINPGLTADLTIPVSFSSASQDAYTIASKSYATNPTFDVAAGTITVPANSYVVMVNNKVLLDVEGIEVTEDALSVYGTDGALIVNNAPAGIEVYALDGTLRYASKATSANIELAKGLYIVRSGSTSKKVIVK